MSLLPMFLRHSKDFTSKWPIDFRVKRIVFIQFLILSKDQDLFHRKRKNKTHN